MRPADINRVKRAKEHLKAAATVLSSIKWENTTLMESELIQKSKDEMRDADGYLDDIININKH